MAEPKSKVSRARRGMRRSHDALKVQHHSICPNCGAIRRNHRVCGECGFYKGQEVLSVN